MLTTVKGTYDHGQIIWDEVPPAPVQKRTKVIVTFLENELSIQQEVEGADSTNKTGIRFGSLAGKVSVPDNFNEPLDDLNEYM